VSDTDAPAADGSLSEVALLFLKLGCIAFGGPAAHVAMMRQEVVERRRWVSDQRFLDLFAAANLIPGPSSTELAIFLGYVRAGWPALILAGVLFIAPAMLLVLAFAWVYVHLGHLPAVGWLLYGIKPVIIAVIVQALVGLGRTAVKGRAILAVTGLTVFALYLLGVGSAAEAGAPAPWHLPLVALYLLGRNVILLLFGAGIAVMLIQNVRRLSVSMTPAIALTGAPAQAAFALFSAESARGPAITLPLLFLTFLKLGAVVYGSGYVLLAFLQADFVDHLHWLTSQQLIDAVAVGQFTPGPVFTTATFLGYLFAGVPGALLATLAIFLPSFILVPVVFPLVGWLRRSPWLSAFLDGANAAALGLMAAVSLVLARAALVDPLTIALAAIALVALLKFKPNSAWLVLGGGIVGIAGRLVGV
jgi:chromate transporter